MDTLRHQWVVCLGLLLSSGALAADLPVKAKAPAQVVAYNWTGFYMGAHVGYGWGNSSVDVTPLPSPEAFLANAFSQDLRTKGWLGGIQAGYNWSSGGFLIGVEGDIAVANIHGDGRFGPLTDPTFTPPPPIPGTFHDSEQKLDWLGTWRARIGLLAAERALLYATGGLAVAHVKYSAFSSVGLPGVLRTQFSASDSDTKVGWTAGAGIEWALTGNWTAKVEYLYYDLGHHVLTANPMAPNPPYQVQSDFETKGHIVRVGINYRFVPTAVGATY